MSMAFKAMVDKSKEIKWPEFYREDLLVHDRKILKPRSDGAPFMWFLKQCGTRILTGEMYEKDAILAGNRNYEDSILEHLTCPSTPKHYGFLWDGEKLVEVPIKEWVTTFHNKVLKRLPLYQVKWTRKDKTSFRLIDCEISRLHWSMSVDELHRQLSEHWNWKRPDELHTIEIITAPIYEGVAK